MIGNRKPATVREYLINHYARYVFRVLLKKGTPRDFAIRIAMKQRLDMLAGRKRIAPIGVKDEKRKLARAGECVYCGQAADTVDHLIPRMQHGPDAADNLVPACRFCNSSKGGRDVLDWAESRQIRLPFSVIRRYWVLAWQWADTHGKLDEKPETLTDAPFRMGRFRWPADLDTMPW